MRPVRIPKAAQQPAAAPKKPKRLRHLFAALTVVVLTAGAANYLRPLPAATIVLRLPDAPAPRLAAVEWPEYGQSSLTDTAGGSVMTHGAQTKLATASIAKVITALCVLQKYPLQTGQIGPSITMTDDDVEHYRTQLAQNGSNLPIYSGEQLTEYQALQALMIPSANNIADTLAAWAFGSLENYSKYANNYVLQHGLTNTRIGTADASGLDPSTVSTAEDLARLGQLALKEPVLRDIAAQRSAVFPFAGELTNYNTKLGAANISGIKTGNNDQNKGALLYAAPIALGEQSFYVTGAVMGADSLDQALASSEKLVKSAAQNYENITYLKSGQNVGTLHTAWGATAPLTASKKLSIVRWKTVPLSAHATNTTVTGMSSGTVGTVELRSASRRASVDISQQSAVPGPPVWWRLLRH